MINELKTKDVSEIVVVERINKSIDNTGDFNNVRKIGDRCRFMGCKGKVEFLKYDLNFMNRKSVVLICPECKTEHYKKIKIKVKSEKQLKKELKELFK